MNTHKCNDCEKFAEPLMVKGYSDAAGGCYYEGAGICEHCIKERRERSILWVEAGREFFTKTPFDLGLS